jgi:O-antigen ligase
MKSNRVMQMVTWAGLAGYALLAPATIAGSQICFGLALTGFIGYLATIRDRRPVFPPTAILAVMAAYTLYRFVSMAVAGADLVAIKEDWLFLMVIVAAVMFQDVRNLSRILDFFAAGVMIMGGYGIWQHFVGVDFYHGVLLDRMTFGYRAIGNFSTYLTFSGFFAVASIFLVPAGFAAAGKRRKFAYLLASQVGLACILFNYSRSTIVALIIGAIALVVMISARYRKWVSLILLLTLAVGIVISPDFLHRFKNLGKTEFSIEYANSRFAIWETALVMVKEKPVFGVGSGNFQKYYLEYRKNRTGRTLSHAHNDILNTAAVSGIPCAVLFMLLWLLIFRAFYRGYMKCPDGYQRGLILGAFLASLVFLAMAQFEAFFADEEVRMLLMFVWGIGLAVVGNLKTSERLSEIA